MGKAKPTISNQCTMAHSSLKHWSSVLDIDKKTVLDRDETSSSRNNDASGLVVEEEKEE